MIGVQVMVPGLFAGQLVAGDVGLPGRVGAPAALLACCGVKEKLGELCLKIGNDIIGALYSIKS